MRPAIRAGTTTEAVMFSQQPLSGQHHAAMKWYEGATACPGVAAGRAAHQQVRLTNVCAEAEKRSSVCPEKRAEYIV